MTEKFLNGTLSAEEKKILDDWYYEGRGEEAEVVIHQPTGQHSNEDELKQQLLHKIHQGMSIEPRQKRKLLLKPIMAAAAVLAITISFLFFFSNREHVENTGAIKGVEQPEILPGKEGAVLTLADGTEVILDSLGNGIVANQGASELLLKDGQLIYAAAHSNEAMIAVNSMTTPKGRQFKVALPDGTVVWMNAETRLEYPTSFKGERKVKLTGEAYFEVVTNKELPFKVVVNDREEILVYGTKFNIKAYSNEDLMQTTLLEGSVRVRTAGDQKMLIPGQQALVRNGIAGFAVSEANTEKVMAWKNGLFNFEDAGLEEVMRQLSRWYDIEVVYAGAVPVMEFGGEMKRNSTLNDVLLALESTKVHFIIEKDRKLKVMQ